MLCSNFQNDLTTEVNIMTERDLAKFKFKMRFGQETYIVEPLG